MSSEGSRLFILNSFVCIIWAISYWLPICLAPQNTVFNNHPHCSLWFYLPSCLPPVVLSQYDNVFTFYSSLSINMWLLLWQDSRSLFCQRFQFCKHIFNSCGLQRKANIELLNEACFHWVIKPQINTTFCVWKITECVIHRECHTRLPFMIKLMKSMPGIFKTYGLYTHIYNIYNVYICVGMCIYMYEIYIWNLYMWIYVFNMYISYMMLYIFDRFIHIYMYIYEYILQE